MQAALKVMAEMQRIPMDSPRKAGDPPTEPGGALPGLLESQSKSSASLPGSHGQDCQEAVTYTLQSTHNTEEDVKKGKDRSVPMPNSRMQGCFV